MYGSAQVNRDLGQLRPAPRASLYDQFLPSQWVHDIVCKQRGGTIHDPCDRGYRLGHIGTCIVILARTDHLFCWGDPRVGGAGRGTSSGRRSHVGRKSSRSELRGRQSWPRHDRGDSGRQGGRGSGGRRRSGRGSSGSRRSGRGSGRSGSGVGWCGGARPAGSRSVGRRQGAPRRQREAHGCVAIASTDTCANVLGKGSNRQLIPINVQLDVVAEGELADSLDLLARRFETAANPA